MTISFLAHLLAGDGPCKANLGARQLLLSKLSARQLIKYRRVIPEWRDTINGLLENRAKTLLLFNDTDNVKDYMYFLTKSKYVEEEELVITARSHSLPNLALCVKNIQKVAESGLLDHMKSVKRLVYFGDADLKAIEPSVVYHESWHAYLHKFVLRLKSLNLIMVHHYGYYNDNFPFESNGHFYRHIKWIHLVQPGRYALNELIRATSFCEVVAGYRFNHPSRYPILERESTPDQENRQGLVKIIAHQLVAWGPSHSDSEQAGEHLLEEYPYTRFRF